MASEEGSVRRAFLRQAAASIGAVPLLGEIQAEKPTTQVPHKPAADRHAGSIQYPRVFTGPQLARIAFPLGGVGAGSLSLGGRGQLRDWEIFNRPHKGNTPKYAFPSLFVQLQGRKPVARVLESRILPPYEGQEGLGADNVPGLSRLASATFTGEYPLARVQFEDTAIPVQVSLEAFSPFVPHDADDSGLPVAILRYRVTNPNPQQADVSIAFSIDNPVKISQDRGGAATLHEDSRRNEYVHGQRLSGLLMSNPGIADGHPMKGTFALGAQNAPGTVFTYWRGWPKGRWWNSPMLFWDQFSAHGELTAEPDSRNSVGALCLRQSIAPGQSGAFTFLLAWHFANRTPAWCGWEAPKGFEDTIIGNFYATRFENAWAAAGYAEQHLEQLEIKTKRFATALRDSTLPPVIKEAASANLSTLASTTCFRTADGEFHGFEGVDDNRGCCFGNCTHVWNYETATAHLFPSLALSLRKASFGYSMDDRGGMQFRQLLPDGKARFGYAAADGQMGQIVHAYLDWILSGDRDWLMHLWPRIKKAIEFAWIPGGWDADRDGVLEGVQHNTYDVEFYGPNPLCGIYYLAALRACEEMALAVGEDSSAAEYRRLFTSGSRSIDATLFNGEYYVQKIRGYAPSQIADALRGDMGSEDTGNPQYQVGEGCLIDQLLGQYLADVAGLGLLVSRQNIQTTLKSLYRYNYKRGLSDHDAVQRTFALNDESALVICDYAKAQRPRIPFPYYAEVMTGFEYSAAVLMMYEGMVEQGVECIHNIRARYDGTKRNPWDEAECGHHYARAMAAWSGIIALSGFHYDGPTGAVTAVPKWRDPHFQSFWSTGLGWGTYSTIRRSGSTAVTIKVLSGKLSCSSLRIDASGAKVAVASGSEHLAHTVTRGQGTLVVQLTRPKAILEGSELTVQISA